ncbi:hypothetical protein CsatA_012451 [Cannabis sativa]
MQTNTNNSHSKRVVTGRSLIDFIFSWSIKDVLNYDLYKNQVEQIPDTFGSKAEYFKAFIVPLVEETHADLSSGVKAVAHSVWCEIRSVKQTKQYNPPKDFFYKAVLRSNEMKNHPKAYKPENGDLIAITSVKPRSVNDLHRHFVIASVQGVKDDVVTLLSSKPILFENSILFAVYLINMNTNIRIWQALTSDPKERNMKIIDKVIKSDFPVTERLVKRVIESSTHDTYGLGDIVLIGNGRRMNIEERDELQSVFLQNRVDVFNYCFGSKTGWKDSLVSMISLLEEPVDKYRLYLKEREIQGLKENSDECGNSRPLSFGKFFKENFSCILQRLNICVVSLYTHLPTSCISLQVVKSMVAAVESLKSFEVLFNGVVSETLKLLFERNVMSEDHIFEKFNVARENCICQLESLPSTFSVPDFSSTKEVMDFCLEKACLVFCTVSGSAELHNKGMRPLEVLVIDEAAQLKECESAIPLQLPGLRHAILIGDERQLPAMVKSKISEEANFGRSLFERLSFLGHKKHLLNVQHRMHPAISQFPNSQFYDNKILDGHNVKLRSYSKTFLQGKMYGSYSFINVAQGKETCDNKHSSKNMVEVAVVSEILDSLYKEVKGKKKVSVGVISPYKAQVFEISEMIGNKYSSDAQSDFSVSVRSVDGFQGGEDDVIIISTVRSNGKGSVGFLSNHQRANVVLTRARHCLWIVGNGSTLANSSTVWRKLVIDAKERMCYHNADEDKNLALAITSALVQSNQIHLLPNLDPLLFKDSVWKVCFNDSFWSSMASVKDKEFCNEMFSLLRKLSCGWRQEHKDSNLTSSHFVEHYIIKEMYLVWSVDLVKEDSNQVQILKIWDVLVQSCVQKLTNQLDMLYGNFSTDKMHRCKYKKKEGNLVFPMMWRNSDEEDLDDFLSNPLAALSLRG